MAKRTKVYTYLVRYKFRGPRTRGHSVEHRTETVIARDQLSAEQTIRCGLGADRIYIVKGTLRAIRQENSHNESPYDLVTAFGSIVSGKF